MSCFALWMEIPLALPDVVSRCRCLVLRPREKSVPGQESVLRPNVRKALKQLPSSSTRVWPSWVLCTSLQISLASLDPCIVRCAWVSRPPCRPAPTRLAEPTGRSRCTWALVLTRVQRPDHGFDSKSTVNLLLVIISSQWVLPPANKGSGPTCSLAPRLLGPDLQSPQPSRTDNKWLGRFPGKWIRHCTGIQEIRIQFSALPFLPWMTFAVVPSLHLSFPPIVHCC